MKYGDFVEANVFVMQFETFLSNKLAHLQFKYTIARQHKSLKNCGFLF